VEPRKSTRRFTPIGIAVLLAALAFVDPVAAAKSFGSDGGLVYKSHVFPVEGVHWRRGALGEFGAPRSGGRVHEGFDVVAPCGAGLLAVRTGTVLRRGHDPVLYGNFLLIHGSGERRSYFYSHLRRPSPLRRGDRVWAGRRVGAVGKTGNARTVGCHLHFELRVDGRPIDPEPLLRGWDRDD